MKGIYTISLNQVRLFAEHGMYDEEKLVGNEFEINVQLQLPEVKTELSLSDTVNYVDVYHLISERFSKRALLLENLAREIVSDLHSRFPGCNKISVQIRKLVPPIINFTGAVSVEYSKEFEQ